MYLILDIIFLFMLIKILSYFQLNFGTLFKRDYVHVLKLVSPVDEIWSGPYSPGNRTNSVCPVLYILYTLYIIMIIMYNLYNI